MKLTVVGCAPAYSTKPDHSSSCYLVEQHETTLAFDMGQGSFSQLWRYTSPARITAVVISHMHADHNVDLIPLRHWARYGNHHDGPALFGPTELRRRFSEFQVPYGEPSVHTDFFSDLKGAALEEGSLSVGDLRIQAQHVTHIPDSYAFRVSAADDPTGRGLVYSGDCGEPDDLRPLVQPGDVLLCEAGYGVARDSVGIHLTAGEAASVAERSGAARLILTHVHDRANAEPLVNAAREVYRGTVDLAEPGMQVDIS